MKKKNVLFALAALLATGCGHSISGTYTGTVSTGQTSSQFQNFNTASQNQTVTVTLSENNGTVQTSYSDGYNSLSGTLHYDGNSAITGTLTGNNNQQYTINWNDDGTNLTGSESSGYGGMSSGYGSIAPNISLKCSSGDCS
jgi:major membrane immunogen (membrane-anchored lipoprotein)